MADAPVFEWVCTELERRTAFDRLEARGTVRLALKQAGLEARSLVPQQMMVVAQKLLPDELRARGVGDADDVCRMLAIGLQQLDLEDRGAAESPDEIFRRLAGTKDQ